MKHRPRSEIADLVLCLKNNLDEAEQFESYIDGLIRNCDKKYLLSMLPQMCDAVEYNLELYEKGYKERSCICDCPYELKILIKEIREEMNK